MLNAESNCNVGSLTLHRIGIQYFHNKIKIKGLRTDICLTKSLITRQAIL